MDSVCSGRSRCDPYNGTSPRWQCRSQASPHTPEETAAEVEAALSLLASATVADSVIVITDSDQIPKRPRKHVQDIARLFKLLALIAQRTAGQREWETLRSMMTARLADKDALIATLQRQMAEPPSGPDSLVENDTGGV